MEFVEQDTGDGGEVAGDAVRCVLGKHVSVPADEGICQRHGWNGGWDCSSNKRLAKG